MTPAYWLESVMMGLSLDQPEIPSHLRYQIRELIDTIGYKKAWKIVEFNKSPDILSIAKSVCRKLAWIGEDGKPKPDSVTSVIEWLLETKSQSQCRAFMSAGEDVQILADAITRGEELRRVWIVG